MHKLFKKLSILAILLVAMTLLSAESYTLNEIKKLALDNNKSLQSSKMEFEASNSVRKNAITSYFPNVSASYLKMKAKDDLIQTTFMNMPMSMLDEMEVTSILAIQPVFTGGRIIYSNQLAKLGKDVNKDLVELKRNEVLKTAEQKYWQIYTLNEKLKTLQAYEKMLGDLYKEACSANKAGLILRNDLLKITLKQNELNISKLQLESGINLAKKSLSIYIGMPTTCDFTLTDTICEPINPGPLYIIKKAALPNRTEYRILKKQITAEELQTKIKRGEFLPSVSVGANAFRMEMMNDTQDDYLVFANVSIPISDWWGGSYTLEERKYKEKKKQSEVNDQIDLLSLQIDKNWDDLNVMYKQIDYAQQAIIQAEENVKINNDNYKSGTINISDMLESQALLQESQDRLIEVKSNYRLAYIEYLQNTGRAPKE